MPPLPTTFDDATKASIASIQRRQNDLREFQIPRLRGCSESLSVQQQYAAEIREDLESITHLVGALDETIEIQHSERSQRDLRGIVESFKADLTQLRRDMRAALLASKRAIDAKLASNREELLRSSVLNQTRTSDGKATDDAVMKAQADVTDALRRTMTLMQNELEKSVLSTQMLETSTTSLKATSSIQDVLTGLLGSSKQLVTALEKADWLDRILIFAGLAFFILVVLFILKQRILDRGFRIAFWWTRFLPRGDSQLDVKQEMMEKGVTITQSLTAVASSVVASTATALASQLAHAAGSDWDGPSSSTPGGHVHDKVSHIFPDPDTIDSSLLATTTTLPMREPPTTDSIHDEL